MSASAPPQAVPTLLVTRPTANSIGEIETDRVIVVSIDKKPKHDPKGITWSHWILLLLGSILMMGNYYCYDIPGSINVPLQNWLGSDYDLFQLQLNMLYTAYSAPNIVIPIIGGYFVDKLGSTRMLLIFALLVCIGQTIFSIGLTFKYFPMLVLGRFLFGLGGESLEVAQARITTDWFGGHALAFALGLNLTFARLSTALNDNISPWVTRLSAPPSAGWVGFGVCVSSFVSALLIIHMDRPASRIAAGVPVQKNTSNIRSGTGINSEGGGRLGSGDTDSDALLVRSPIVPTAPLLVSPKSVVAQDDNQDSISVSETTPLMAQQTPNRKIIEVRDGGRVTVSADDDIEDGYESEEYDENDERVHISQVWRLSGKFWLLALGCITLYGSVVPFFHICTDYFSRKWGMDHQMAGFVMSVPDFISAVGSPLSGLFLDKFGYRGTFLPISSLLLLLSYITFHFTPWTPILGMSIIGLAYSLFAASLWPCVPRLVGRHQIATGYGVMSVALNVSLAFVPLVVARIMGDNNNAVEAGNGMHRITQIVGDYFGGRKAGGGGGSSAEVYDSVMAFFMVGTMVSFMVGLSLVVLDRCSGNVLDRNDENSTDADDEDSNKAVAAANAEETQRLLQHVFEGYNSSDDDDTSRHLAMMNGLQNGVVAATTVEEVKEGNHDEEDSEEVSRVVGDGIVVVTRQTLVHHHHHKRIIISHPEPGLVHVASIPRSPNSPNNHNVTLATSPTLRRGRPRSRSDVTHVHHDGCSCHDNEADQMSHQHMLSVQQQQFNQHRRRSVQPPPRLHHHHVRMVSPIRPVVEAGPSSSSSSMGYSQGREARDPSAAPIKSLSPVRRIHLPASAFAIQPNQETQQHNTVT